ncbi:MAG: 2-oxoacid:ferredoxin oxidoreductase subunit beta [Nitrospinota bacterium]
MGTESGHRTDGERGGLSRKDFASDQMVRWCPGCGDFAILAQMQKVLPELGLPPEKYVFVSGIGCSSRFPYYMNTYGVHGIHGRAPAIATGIKVMRPDLQVWVMAGDGDALSIGGNHILHTMRRNVDINIVVFNNRIYGLTKGQLSPTSEVGKKTKSSPVGSVEEPVNPISVALGAGASFAARAVDVDQKHMAEVFRRAALHKGTAFIEVLQNCIVFNDGAFALVSDRGMREEHALYLEHGKPLLFGKERNKGIRLWGLTPEVVTLGEGVREEDLLVHDEHNPDPSYAFLLSQFTGSGPFPVPLGVFHAVERPTYEEALGGQVKAAKARLGQGDLESLLHGGDTWYHGGGHPGDGHS